VCVCVFFFVVVANFGSIKGYAYERVFFGSSYKRDSAVTRCFLYWEVLLLQIMSHISLTALNMVTGSIKNVQLIVMLRG
jgi:hypothetical protein